MNSASLSLKCVTLYLPDVADGTSEGLLARMNPLVNVVLSLKEPLFVVSSVSKHSSRGIDVDHASGSN
jgi:hypothetical protein